jgi:putative peptidoglycan lipid II flippase
MGFRWRLRFDWRHHSVGRLARLGQWVVLYVGLNQLALIAIINLNHRIGAGAYTAYAFAFIFFSLPHAIVSVSIVTSIVPGMAERWSRQQIDGVRELFSNGMRDTLVMMLPAAAGYIALAGPIAGLFASYGAGAGAGTELMAQALGGFALGLPFFSAFQLLTRTFYATQDARTPALVNIVVAFVNIGADLLLAFALDLGVRGLALGFAASYVAGTVTLLLLLRRRLGGIDGANLLRTAVRALPAAAAAGLLAWACSTVVASFARTIGPSIRLTQVLAGVAAGVLAFWVGALLFGVREVDEVRRALGGRVRR